MVQKALEGLAGVRHAEVSLTTKQAVVTYDANRVTEAQMLGGETMPSSVLVASTRFIERRSDWTRAWVATHRALVREINADPAGMSARVNEALKRRTGKALKPAVLRQAWSRLTITDQVSDRHLIEFAGMMRGAGYLRVAFDPVAFRETPVSAKSNAAAWIIPAGLASGA